MNSQNLKEEILSGSSPELNLEEKLKAIEQNVAILKERAEIAKQEKERYINKKIVDREALLAQSIKLNDLEKAAQQMVDSLLPLKEQEGLKDDPEFQKQVEETEALLNSLHEQQEEVNRQIAAIEAHPDIVGKLHDEAIKMNKEVDERKELEALEIEFKQEVAQFAEEVRAYMNEKIDCWDTRDNLNDRLQAERQKFMGIVKGAIEGISSDKTKDRRAQFALGNLLEAIRSDKSANIVRETFNNLVGIKQSLGYFGATAGRQAIDLVLSKDAELQTYEKLLGERAELQKVNLDQVEEELREKCRDINKRFTKLNGSSRSLTIYQAIREVDDALAKKKNKYGFRAYESFKYAINEIR